MTMETLELRLRTLERRDAERKLFVLLAVVLVVGGNLAGLSGNLLADAPRPEVQDTVRAHRIEVVDPNGKVLAMLGNLHSEEFHATTGLALLHNDKRVVQLAVTRSRSDGSMSSAELEVFNPEDAKGLFSAGVVEYTEGIGFVPQIELKQREAKSMTTVNPSGLGVVVKIENLSYAEALSLRANQDHSATLSLGGLSKPFKLRAIAESDKPRIEVEKGGIIKTFGFGP